MTELIESYLQRSNIPPKDAATIRNVAGHVIEFAKIPIKELEKLPESKCFSTAVAKQLIAGNTRLDFETRRELAWLIDKTVFSIQQGVNPRYGSRIG